MTALLGQIVFTPRAWGLAEWFILIVVVAGAVAILHIVLPRLGVQIPPWVVQIFWVLVIVFVAILAIRLLFSL